ncbi:MAG: PKD domain-containing protein, partial [bacterium]|nr:PKD domain-containing protein [bacterium]
GAPLANGCSPFSVQFSADDQGDGFSYSWSFEGGNPEVSEVANPLVSFAAPGIYDVSLTVTNAAGTTSVSETEFVVVNEGPETAFDLQNILGELQVDFSNASTNADAYTWDFGDGQSGIEMSPVHTYTEAGVYTISLIAQNECGTDTVYHDIELILPPAGGFSASLTSGCSPFSV